MVTNKLDMRNHPYFIWSVTNEVACEFFTGIKGGALTPEVGEMIITDEGVVVHYLGDEKWKLTGYSTTTTKLGDTNVQTDLYEVVMRIVNFGKVINQRVEMTQSEEK
jgi:hypothetical protein